MVIGHIECAHFCWCVGVCRANATKAGTCRGAPRGLGVCLVEGSAHSPGVERPCSLRRLSCASISETTDARIGSNQHAIPSVSQLFFVPSRDNVHPSIQTYKLQFSVRTRTISTIYLRLKRCSCSAHLQGANRTAQEFGLPDARYGLTPHRRTQILR